jgi:uncharacterized protein YbaR (Trm112 family)
MIVCPKCDSKIPPLYVDSTVIVGMEHIHVRCNACGHDYEVTLLLPVRIRGE